MLLREWSSKLDNIFQQLRKSLEQSIGKRKAVFLFTGDNGSTFLLDVVKDTDVKIVFIDTGYHFEETMDYIKSFEGKIWIIKNNDVLIDHTVDMDKCCNQRKAETLKEYLDNVKAEYLMVPFRDEERASGIESSYIKGIDNIKILRPLAKLTARDIWLKVKEYKLPFSMIYKKGYRFVDCRCCMTRHGRKKHVEDNKSKGFDRETEETLKALGYM
jgi:3'-phosphoadenosine 5'-phosphosulfate sulfotransferase (PAPS reductase)/FAD synthetase